MTKIKHKTREGWLVAGVSKLDGKFFAHNGYDLPKKWQVSCGFPRASAKAIGQCWDPEVSADGTTQMFVCPSLANPVEVLAILLHEMIHASVGVKVGHKGVFRKLVKEFGLAGKMTATFAEEGSDLEQTLKVLAEGLGAYPHAAMKRKRKSTSSRPTWVVYVSPDDEDYKLSASPVVVESYGPPKDPWGNEMRRAGQ